MSNEVMQNPRAPAMNDTLSTSQLQEATTRLSGFVDIRTLGLFIDYLFCGTGLSIIVLGVIANMINIAVFSKIGLKDSVMVTFLLLSVSDLSYLFLSCFTQTCRCFESMGLDVSDWSVNPSALGTYLVWYQVIFYQMSIVTTAYLAIARCCCVTLALKFRSLFTVSRTILVLSVSLGVVIALHIPTISAMELVWNQRKGSNGTVLSLVYHSGWDAAVSFHDLANRNVVTNSCLAIVIICLVVLTRALRKASEFRQKTASHQTPARHDQTGSRNQDESFNENKRQRKEKVSLSRKDAKVIKSVSLVSAMFAFTSMLTVIKNLARLAAPEFSSRKQYSNTYVLVTIITTTFAFLNSSANIVVYFCFNSKYRHTLLQCWRKGTQRQ